MSQGTFVYTEEELLVMAYGFIYTNMKQRQETSCNCFKWGGEGVEGER
jgi:hypothetical protein